jgi:hypothetical protein
VNVQDDPSGSTAVAVLTGEAAAASSGPTPATAPRRRRWLIALVAAGIVLVLLVVAGIVANASLSQTYSARRAVEDYFAAQAHRNVDGMLANATFVRPEGSYSDFFGRVTLKAMMQLPQNSAIQALKVTRVERFDSQTELVTVSLTWNGTSRTETYKVSKDTTRIHWLLYPSWRVQIPSTTLNLTLPKQAGSVTVDGVAPPPAANTTVIQTIRGFHQVRMESSSIVDVASLQVDATAASANVELPGKITDFALASAKTAVTNAFNNCDAAKYEDCIGHTYTAPNNNFIYYLILPGYGNVDYTTYAFTLANDPTADMKVTIESDAGKASATGSCALTMTLNGGRRYSWHGTYTATLTWETYRFSADVTVNCQAIRG